MINRILRTDMTQQQQQQYDNIILAPQNTTTSTFSPVLDVNMDGVVDRKDTIIRASALIGMGAGAYKAASSGRGFFGVIGFAFIGLWLGSGLGIIVSETVPNK